MNFPPIEQVREAVQTGIFPGMAFDRYRTLRALSQSVLKVGEKSMYHLAECVQHPEWNEDSESTVLGTALHMMLLEPERFDREVIEGPINPKTGKGYGVDTNAWRDFAAANPGRVVLGADQRQAVESMALSVLSIPEARRLLQAVNGDNEVTAVWRDPASGVLCKARRDRLTEDGFGIDIKTTRDASPRDFKYSCRNYGYDFQDAYYRRGFAACGEDHVGVIIAVENVRPYAAALYRFDEATLANADMRIDRLLAEYALCESTGKWGGYGDEIQELSLT